jgi:L-asparaginase II
MSCHSPIISIVTRGEIPESKHYGHIAVVNHKGKLLYSIGDPSSLTFFRSCLKPFQAATVLSTCANEEYQISTKELAFISSSHHSEPRHIECLEQLLHKVKIPASALYCGRSKHDLETTTKIPAKTYHECSGKHVGLMAAAKKLGEDFHQVNCLHHPVQEMIMESIAHYCDYTPTAIGIDGCGLPTVAVPLESIAFGYAKIAEEYGKSAVGQIASSMTKHPWFVGGTHQFDTEIMRAFRGEVVAKAGAEGIICLSIPSKKIGIAIKCEDGSHRPIPMTVLALLEKLNLLTKHGLHTLKQAHPHWHKILNSRNESVGSILSSI